MPLPVQPALAWAPQTASLQSVHLPAPIGGINSLASGADAPAGDCLSLVNMVAAEYGLRSRLGYREYVRGLSGAVTSVLPFTGSKGDGSEDRLFACTTSGIYDCTSSTTTPSRVFTFPHQADGAGWGVSHALTTLAGHYLLYADEQNGYCVYSEASRTWSQPDSAPMWQQNTWYNIGDRVYSTAVYECITAGTSAGSGAGPAGTGSNITDGTATPAPHWRYVGVGIGGLDTTKVAFVCVWKSRVWFVERDTAHAWYLDVGSLYGAATRFDFGAKFRAGGYLVGLWSWTGDGGAGMDDYLVAVSSGADIVVYEGTDPANAATFGIKGVWFGGAVPAGRQIATDFGGDMLLLCAQGVLPLSKLVIGNVIFDRSQYATSKITNLFAGTFAQRASARGWFIRVHPGDNTLIVNTPDAGEVYGSQLAMSLATRGWSQYQGVPMVSAAVWRGKLYFGTPDGRVCVNDGYVDNASLDGSFSPTNIEWSGLTTFQEMGSARKKRIAIIRPIYRSAIPVASQAEPRYDFDITGIAAPPALDTGAVGIWDAARWNQAVWASEPTAVSRYVGATGIGTLVAIGFRGVSDASVVLGGFDVLFDQGGVL